MTLQEKIEALKIEAKEIKSNYPRVKEVEYRIDEAEYDDLIKIDPKPSLAREAGKYFTIVYDGIAQIVIWSYAYDLEVKAIRRKDENIT